MKKKLSSQKGETLLETLIALLIIVVSISFLTTAIIKSDSILREVKLTKEKGFSYETGDGTNWEVSAESADGLTAIMGEGQHSVTGHVTAQFEGSDLNYYYYDYRP